MDKKKLQKLDDNKKFSIIINGIGIECQKLPKQVRDERDMEANKRLKCYSRLKINPKAFAILILIIALRIGITNT